MKMLVVFLSLLSVSQHASGVQVYQGEEPVLLPCQVDASKLMDSIVVWSRADLKLPVVHKFVYPDGDDLRDQNQRYRNRTSMRTDALQSGDLSLSLRKPNIFDSDNYTCSVIKVGEKPIQTEVELQVREPPPVWPKVLPGVLVPLLFVVAAVGGFIMCRKYKELMDKIIPQVEVESGAESVQLPFITTADLPEDIRVEWTDRDNRKVHVYEDGSDRPEKQHRFYRNRTEMKKDLLRPGDLSLTLKPPTGRDTNIYTCRVYREGRVLIEKQVKLKVTAPQDLVEVESGAESVQLPFKTSADLPENITVEWRDWNYWKVHVYQDGSDRPEKQHRFYRNRTEMKKDLLRPGDLSLILKHPTVRVTDNRSFTCRVYREGKVLMVKEVWLWFKGHFKVFMLS